MGLEVIVIIIMMSYKNSYVLLYKVTANKDEEEWKKGRRMEERKKDGRKEEGWKKGRRMEERKKDGRYGLT